MPLDEQSDFNASPGGRGERVTDGGLSASGVADQEDLAARGVDQVDRGGGGQPAGRDAGLGAGPDDGQGLQLPGSLDGSRSPLSRPER
jgi:hypothetical protein